MPHDFFSFFVCNIEKCIIWCNSAKENCYNSSQVIFKVSSRIFFTYLQKPVCVLYSTHIFYLHSYLYKVFFPVFTIPETESQRNISLSFWIKVATSLRCALGVGKVKPFFCLNAFTQKIWIIFHLKPMPLLVKLAANF